MQDVTSDPIDNTGFWKILQHGLSDLGFLRCKTRFQIRSILQHGLSPSRSVRSCNTGLSKMQDVISDLHPSHKTRFQIRSCNTILRHDHTTRAFAFKPHLHHGIQIASGLPSFAQDAISDPIGISSPWFHVEWVKSQNSFRIVNSQTHKLLISQLTKAITSFHTNLWLFF